MLIENPQRGQKSHVQELNPCTAQFAIPRLPDASIREIPIN
jgi:hypothetical protein